MRSWLQGRFDQVDGEVGMTLIEILVALVMGLIVVGGATAMLISAVRDQPKQQQQADSISTARYELERMTREIRNGVSVTTANSNGVSFVARVRRQSCGGESSTSASAPAIQCQIVYSCTTSTCARTEREVGKTTGGVPTTIVRGIDSAEVFCFVPSVNTDPTECGTPKAGVSPTYIGITLNVPNPNGSGSLTITDGASLRSATLAY